MMDLYTILIPAVLLVAFLGLWVIKDMSRASKFYGRLLTIVVTACVAGIIAIAFVTGIAGLLGLATITIVYLWRRGHKI